MPELPEVEVVKQSLQKYILNKKLIKIIVKNKKLRFPIPKNLSRELSNQEITKVKRVSKYLIIEFKDQIKDALAGVDSGYSKEAGSSSQHIDSFIY